MTISDWQQPDPIHIMMNQLFKKPGSEPDTQAKLRLKLHTAQPEKIEMSRKVYVEFFSDDDFEANPVYTFDMASSLFKVEGNLGNAEFLTPSIALGSYIVRVFLDSNGDGFLDTPELFGTYSEMGSAKLIELEQDHTKTISLDLVPKI